MSFLLVGFKLCSSRCVGICLSVAARQENDARRMRQSIGRSDEHLSPARYVFFSAHNRTKRGFEPPSQVFPLSSLTIATLLFQIFPLSSTIATLLFQTSPLSP